MISFRQKCYKIFYGREWHYHQHEILLLSDHGPIFTFLITKFYKISPISQKNTNFTNFANFVKFCCFQTMDLTDEERAMQAQVIQILYSILYFVSFCIFCILYFVFCMHAQCNHPWPRWWSLWTTKRRTWSSRWRNGTPRSRPTRNILHRWKMALKCEENIGFKNSKQEIAW